MRIAESDAICEAFEIANEPRKLRLESLLALLLTKLEQADSMVSLSRVSQIQRRYYDISSRFWPEEVKSWYTHQVWNHW